MDDAADEVLGEARGPNASSSGSGSRGAAGSSSSSDGGASAGNEEELDTPATLRRSSRVRENTAVNMASNIISSQSSCKKLKAWLEQHGEPTSGLKADLEKRVRDYFHRLEVLNGGMEEAVGLAESTPLNEVHAVLNDQMTACLEAAFSEADSETSLKDENDEFKELLARVRFCAKLMNSSVLKQSRERTGTGANRFMEQGFSTIPGLGGGRKRTAREKEQAWSWISRMKGKCFKERSSPDITWRMRADTDSGGEEGDGIDYQYWDSDEDDYRIVYYDANKHGTDPGTLLSLARLCCRAKVSWCNLTHKPPCTLPNQVMVQR